MGSTNYNLIDRERKDPHTENVDFRELPLQIWYPSAMKHSEEKLNYLQRQTLDIIKNDLMKACELSDINDLNFLDDLKANSYGNTLASDVLSEYPVILFIPGLGMPVNLYSNLHEELASHGYIVVGINFTYVTNPTIFPDGRMIEASKKIDKEKEFRLWIDDVNFVLNELTNINNYGILRNKLNLNRIGIYGHSFGGGVALKLCELNRELIAGIDLDGKIRETQEEINKPFMFIISKQSTESNIPLKELNQKNSSPSYFVNINNINHGTFTDLYLLIEGCKNPPELNVKEATKIIRELITNFFDKYLKNEPINLINNLNQLAREDSKIIIEPNEKAFFEQ